MTEKTKRKTLLSSSDLTLSFVPLRMMDVRALNCHTWWKAFALLLFEKSVVLLANVCGTHGFLSDSHYGFHCHSHHGSLFVLS